MTLEERIRAAQGTRRTTGGGPSVAARVGNPAAETGSGLSIPERIAAAQSTRTTAAPAAPSRFRGNLADRLGPALPTAADMRGFVARMGTTVPSAGATTDRDALKARLAELNREANMASRSRGMVGERSAREVQKELYQVKAQLSALDIGERTAVQEAAQARREAEKRTPAALERADLEEELRRLQREQELLRRERGDLTAVREQIRDVQDRLTAMGPKDPTTRLGWGLKSARDTLVATPGVIGDTVAQFLENDQRRTEDPELAEVGHRMAQVRNQLRYMDKSGSQIYRDLVEEERALSAQYAALMERYKTPVSMDAPGMQWMAEAGESHEKALDGLTGVPRFLGETAISIGQNAAVLPTALINPALPLVAMGAQAGAGKMYELSGRGVGAGEALGRGLVAGGIEAVTEKIPLDSVLDIIQTGGKSALKNLLKQSGVEATEEGLSYVMNYLADKAAKDPEAKFDVGELVQSAAAGGVSGLVFAGAGTGINRLGTYDGGQSGAMLPTWEEVQKNASQGETEDTASIGRMSAAPGTSDRVETIQERTGTRHRPEYTSVDGLVPYNRSEGGVQEPVVIPESAWDQAWSSIPREGTLAQKRSFAERFLKPLFDRTGGVRRYAIDGVHFEGQPYEVTVYKNAINKILSDYDFGVDKVAIFLHLQDILQRSRYAGSGQIVKYNAQGQAIAPRNNQLIRHDYFTAPVVLSDGQAHTVQIDVEVSKADNKYRTHHVINSIELIDDTSAPGLTRNDRMSTATSSTGFTLPRRAGEVKTQDTPTGGGLVLPRAGALPTWAEVQAKAQTAQDVESGQQKTASTGEAGTGLVPLTNQESERLATGKNNIVAKTFGDIVSFVNRAIGKKGGAERLYMGKLPDSTAQFVRAQTGVSVAGYTAILPGDSVQHIFNHHGDSASEEMRGQRAVLPEDVALIPQVLSAPDSVTLSEKTDVLGRPVLVFAKQIGDLYITAQAVTDGRHALTTNTLWIEKGKDRPTIPDAGISTGPVDNARSALPQSPSFDPSIPPAGQGVKTQGAPTGGGLVLPRAGESLPGGDTSSVGAAESGFDDWSHFQNQKGEFHPDGEKAHRQVDVPTTDLGEEGHFQKNISKSAATVMEAEVIPAEMVAEVQQMVLDGKFSYERNTDKGAMARAEETIRSKGWDGAVEYFHSQAQERRTSKDLMALGATLLNHAANSGDGTALVKVLSDYAAMSRAGAQATQANRLLKKMTPQGQLYGIQRSVENLQEGLRRRYRDKAPDVTVDPALAQAFLDAGDQKARDTVMEQIYQDVADQIPSTWRDKWDAWRYLAMLGNARTHVRNIVGNLGFQPVRMVKNEIGAGLERAVSAVTGGKVERTKSFVTDPALFRAAVADFQNVREQALGGRKYDDYSGAIQDKRTIFKLNGEADTAPKKLAGALLTGAEAVRRFNTWALDGEDVLFSGFTYADALTGYLKANGVTAEELAAFQSDAGNRTLTDDEQGAILRYKSSESYTVNAKLRDGAELSESEQRLVEQLDRALSKLPSYEGTVYRHLVFDGFGDAEALHAFLAQCGEGEFFPGSSFLSASTLADGYPVDGEYTVTMVIEGVGARDVAGFGNNFENEVIFPRDADFIITKVETGRNGKAVIHMRERMADVDQRGSSLQSVQAGQTVQPVHPANQGADRLRKISQRNPPRGVGKRGVRQVSGEGGISSEFGATAKLTTELLDQARAYAIREAQKATYRDSNAFSDWVGRLGSKARNSESKAVQALGIVGEGVLPFKRTPANILARGVEYSPLGLVKGVMETVQAARNGGQGISQALDTVAAGLTGTGLFALGALLASMGAVSGGKDEDEKKAAMDDLVGRQNYAMNLPDGTNVTLDWLAPEALPFFMGVEFADLGMENGFQAKDLWEAGKRLTDPMLEMSMLQSLNDILSKRGYQDTGLGELALSALSSYVTQGIPTLGGQLERTTETRRETTYPDVKGQLPTGAQYVLGKVMNKLPGEYRQIPYIDAWGREEFTGGILERAANNFLNPAFMSRENVTELDREVLRLYEQLGDGGVVPDRAAKNVTVSGEKVDLDAEQYVQYATQKGQMAYETAQAAIKAAEYDGLSDEAKARVVKEAYAYANAVAKQDLGLGYEAEDWMNYAREMEPEDRGQFLVVRELLRAAKGSGQGQTNRQREALLDMDGLSVKEKAALGQSIVGDSRKLDYSSPEALAVSLLPESTREKAAEARAAGISNEAFLAAYEAQKGVEATIGTLGKPIENSKALNKKEAIDAATPGLSYEERKVLYALFGVSEKVWGYLPRA